MAFYRYTPKGYGANLNRNTAPVAPTTQAQPVSNPYEFIQNFGTSPDGGWTSKNFAEWGPYGILSQLGGAAGQGVGDLYNSLGDYRNARLGAITSLGAGAQQGLVDTYRNRAMAGAGDAGRREAAMLRANGVQGADAAAGLDAQNRAADASNSYSQQVYDPAAIAQRYAQQMQLSSPEAAFPLLQMILALNSAANQKVTQNDAMHAQRAASSGLGGILGSVLGDIPGLGSLGDIFGQFGQQKQNPSRDPLDYYNY